LVKLGCVRAEQLAERIVNLDPANAEGSDNRRDREQGGNEIREAQRDEPHALDPVRQRMQIAALASRRGLFEKCFRIFARQDFSPRQSATRIDVGAKASQLLHTL
jgi:hypothetical protein